MYKVYKDDMGDFAIADTETRRADWYTVAGAEYFGSKPRSISLYHKLINGVNWVEEEIECDTLEEAIAFIKMYPLMFD